MTDLPRRHGWLLPACVEALFWLLPPVWFLYLYITAFNNPMQAILPHMCVVGALWLGTIGARALLPLPRHGRAYWATALVLIPWLLLMAWYAAAFLGLYSWGRLTTWPIFATYAQQAPYLLATLGYPAWLLWLPAVGVLALLLVAGQFDLLKARWPRLLFDLAEPKQRRMLAGLLAALPVVLGSMIGLTVGTSPFEPIQISLLKSGGALSQNHDLIASPAANAAELDVINSYVLSSDAKRRNVILIVGDALRADHMGIYGYRRATTPFLSALAQEGRVHVVPRVRATCAESLCGLMSMASSRPLHEIPAKPFTLQQVLKRHGYEIHMVLSGDHTNFYGLRDFYGSVDSYVDGSKQEVRWNDENQYRYVNDDQLVLDHIEAMPQADRNQPVMLQIALMSSHGLGMRNDGSAWYQPSYNYYSWFRWSAGPDRIKESDRAGAINFYDNGVQQLDGYVRDILETLGRKGYLEDALVVVTGDHGELLGEHGYFAHAITVREPVLNIPLIFARYGYDAEALADRPLAAQIDIAPTILRDLGMAVPATWAGHALQDEASARAPRRVYFQQTMEAGLYDVSAEGRIIKYWRDHQDGSEYVFDIVRDSTEQANKVDSVPAEKLDAWRLSVVHGGLQRVKADTPNNRVIGIEPEPQQGLQE